MSVFKKILLLLFVLSFGISSCKKSELVGKTVAPPVIKPAVVQPPPTTTDPSIPGDGLYYSVRARAN